MTDFYLDTAGLSAHIFCRYDDLKRHSADYLLSDGREDLVVDVTNDDLSREKLALPESSDEYLETLCVHRHLAEKLPAFDRLLCHGAAITFGEDAYLFTAPSGTGKSTHIKLWKSYLGERVGIVNGDKPFLQLDGSTPLVWGSPWAGKEHWQKNRCAPLKAVCFISQGKENKITRTNPADCLTKLFYQVYIPEDSAAKVKTLELLDKLLSSVEIFEMTCDISEAAAKCSFEAMTGCRWEEFRVPKEG